LARFNSSDEDRTVIAMEKLNGQGDSGVPAMLDEVQSA
jgi:hypothetical protein